MSIIMSDYEEENRSQELVYTLDERLMDRSYELNQSIDSMDY